MPTFDFKCTRCAKTFEKRLAVGVRTKPGCPNCGSRATEKLITPPAVHFKGAGFYKTDAGSKPVKTEKSAKPEKTVEAKTPKSGKATT